MTRIRDKPPVSSYPVTDRITGVLCAGILLGCILGCLGPGDGKETNDAKIRATIQASSEWCRGPGAHDGICVWNAERNNLRRIFRPAEGSSGEGQGIIQAVQREEKEYLNPTPLSDDLFRAVDAAADTYHVPLCLALGLIEVESGFDAAAVSPKGCYGLTQLNPKFFPSGLSAEENVQTGLAHLGSLLERYDTMTALTIYNAGRDTGDREYANKVMETAWAWEREFREGANADGSYRRGTG